MAPPDQPGAAAQVVPPPVLQNIPLPEKLKLSGNLASNWKRFSRAWDSYEIASNVKKQDPEIRAATLTSCLGEDAQELLEGLQAPKGNADDIIEVIKTYCIGQTNPTYERYKFFTRDKLASESIDTYAAVLRSLAKTCEFAGLEDSLIRDRIVTGISDNATRRRLLTTDDLTLKKCIDTCRAQETTDHQVRDMVNEKADVHRIGKQPRPKHAFKKPVTETTTPTDQRECKFCGKKHAFKKELCPAYGKVCQKCKGKNHFSVKCRASKRRINAVAQGLYSESDDEQYEVIDSVTVAHVTNDSSQVGPKPVYAEMWVQGNPVRFQLDTGAEVNLISRTHVGSTVIVPSKKQLICWNQSKVKPVGECKLKMKNPRNGKGYEVSFIVVDTNLQPILGTRAVQQMGLVTINTDNFKVAAVGLDLSNYDDIFRNELGDLPGKAHFTVAADARPQISPRHNVPVALKTGLKKCLDDMVSKGVIETVDYPTDWVSNVVLTEKKDSNIRICLDPRPLNNALKREHYALPTIDDVLPELHSARVFSTFDLRSGYWHVTLDDESSKLTTFQTPYGRYKYKRLPFGTSVSSEMFQKRLHQAIGDLEGILTIADDVIAYGVGETLEDAIADHDTKVMKFFQRCRETHIRLNREKMKLRQTEVPFVGHLLTQNGVKADPEKIQAMRDMPEPTDVHGVQRLSGFVNYLAKFLPQLSDVMSPIRQLTHKDVTWTWTDEHQRSFDKVKDMVTNAPILQYYDPTKELVVQCDASQAGLGAALLQEGRPVAYASRALTDVEQRYAQIEKEMLAMVFSLEKFNQYTYGRDVIVYTDHKPLESILKKPLIKAPKRLQSMMLRLQKYDITAVYLQGKEMYLADTLSRAYPPLSAKDLPSEDVQYVHYTTFLPISEERLASIKTHTEMDETLMLLKDTILAGWPNEKQFVHTQVHTYFPFRDELSVQDGIILRGSRVVIPSSLRKTMKEKIHSSHLGVSGCLRRARECLYWPGMSSDIKEWIQTCETCRSFEVSQPKETLVPHDVPDRPWAKVGTDIFTLDGKDYLVTVDYHSNFFEVDRLSDTTSAGVIRKLKSHFARYGVAETIVSDNGPQFSSAEFLHFARAWDFKHCTSSPGHPQANGKAEAAVKIAKNLIKKSQKAGGDPYAALLDYRNTPSPGHDTSPAQRSLGRRTKAFLPMSQDLLKPSFGDTNRLKNNVKRRQSDQAYYYNRHAKDLTALEEGDVVRMQPFSRNETWKKATVTKRLDDRSYEVISQDDRVYRRNRVHLKRTEEKPTSSVQTPKKCPLPVQPPVLVTQTPEQPKVTVPRKVTTPVKVAQQAPETENVPQNTNTTRSGRVIRKPLKYSD